MCPKISGKCIKRKACNSGKPKCFRNCGFSVYRKTFTLELHLNKLFSRQTFQCKSAHKTQESPYNIIGWTKSTVGPVIANSLII